MSYFLGFEMKHDLGKDVAKAVGVSDSFFFNSDCYQSLKLTEKTLRVSVCFKNFIIKLDDFDESLAKAVPKIIKEINMTRYLKKEEGKCWRMLADAGIKTKRASTGSVYFYHNDKTYRISDHPCSIEMIGQSMRYGRDSGLCSAAHNPDYLQYRIMHS